MCCLCSDDPVEGDPYAQGVAFKTSMMDAPCKDPCCCCVACICPWCTAFALRRTVLADDMSKYLCCQGYFDCCCFKAGTLGESNCPTCCLCLEAVCCLSCAVSATRIYAMDQKGLQSDPCDRRLIRCNNCVQLLSCICDILAICIEQLRPCAQLLDTIRHILYCSIQACMQAQVHYEYKDTIPQGVPQKQEMVDGMNKPASAPVNYTG